MNIREIIQQIFETEHPYLNLLALALALIVAVVAHLLVFNVFKRLGKNRESHAFTIIARRLKVPGLFLLLLTGLNFSIPFIALADPFAGPVRHLLSISMIAIIAWVAIVGVRILRQILLNRYDIEQKDNLRARKVYTPFRLLESIVISVIILVTFGVALMTFEKIRQIGLSLLASAGIAGILLVLAAQKIIGAVLAGFQIAITQPIRIEDVVIVKGEWGWIEEITLTYVVVRIWDKRRLILPTTYFIEQPFENWTRVSADIMGTVYIYTDYSVPFDALREELTRLLEAHKLWDGEVNTLVVTDAKERSVEVRALMSAVDSPSLWALRTEVREKLIAFIRDNYRENLPHTDNATG